MKRKDTPQRSLYLVSRSPLASPFRPPATASSVAYIPRLVVPVKHKDPANGAWHSMPRIKPAIRQRSTASFWIQSDATQHHELRAVVTPTIIAHTIESWYEIYASLIPVIGRSGVSAIYQRSLNQTRQTYPWLSEPGDIQEPQRSLQRLSTELAAQNHFVAKAANSLLRRHFRESLSRLLGQNLMALLWHPDWGTALSPPHESTAHRQSQPVSNLYQLNPLA